MRADPWRTRWRTSRSTCFVIAWLIKSTSFNDHGACPNVTRHAWHAGGGVRSASRCCAMLSTTKLHGGTLLRSHRAHNGHARLVVQTLGPWRRLHMTRHRISSEHAMAPESTVEEARSTVPCKADSHLWVYIHMQRAWAEDASPNVP